MVLKIVQQLKRDRMIILFSVLGGILFTTCFALYTKNYSTAIQTDIASEVIRFHVKANSDSEEDQALKAIVKDTVLKNFQTGLKETKNIEESRQYLIDNINNIEECASEQIQQRGYDYAVTVELRNDDFPTKTYGDISLPPGKYEALCVDIGEAEGSNWWCVMFPPLCYVDITQKQVSDKTKAQLKDVLTEDEYNLISNATNEDKIDIQVKFKIVEWWQNKANKNAKYARHSS